MINGSVTVVPGWCKGKLSHAPWPQDAGVHCVTMAIFHQATAMAAVPGYEVKLDIRKIIGIPGFCKAPCLDIVGGQHPFSAAKVPNRGRENGGEIQD